MTLASPNTIVEDTATTPAIITTTVPGNGLGNITDPSSLPAGALALWLFDSPRPDSSPVSVPISALVSVPVSQRPLAVRVLVAIVERDPDWERGAREAAASPDPAIREEWCKARLAEAGAVAEAARVRAAQGAGVRSLVAQGCGERALARMDAEALAGAVRALMVEGLVRRYVASDPVTQARGVGWGWGLEM